MTTMASVTTYIGNAERAIVRKWPAICTRCLRVLTAEEMAELARGEDVRCGCGERIGGRS